MQIPLTHTLILTLNHMLILMAQVTETTQLSMKLDT